MGLHQQRHCQFELKGTEKGRLSDFLGSIGPEERAIQQETSASLQGKGRLTPKAVEILRVATPNTSPGASLLLPGFQRAVPLQGAEGTGSLSTGEGVGAPYPAIRISLPPQWAWKVGYPAKRIIL